MKLDDGQVVASKHALNSFLIWYLVKSKGLITTPDDIIEYVEAEKKRLDTERTLKTVRRS